MLIRNLSINEGLCNGTRPLVLELGNMVLRCEILSGDKTGGIVFLHRITLYCQNEYPFTFKRRQFPVKIAFAMTINKSQGQMFEKISVDLRRDVFNHGQLYVAFSRVRSWEPLKGMLEWIFCVPEMTLRYGISYFSLSVINRPRICFKFHTIIVLT